MAAPQKFIDLAKQVHSDAVLRRTGARLVEGELVAGELVGFLERSPERPVVEIVSAALVDLVAWIHASPSGFRVGGANNHDTLNERVAEFLSARRLSDLPEQPTLTDWFDALS